jgi:hypothetical protein
MTTVFETTRHNEQRISREFFAALAQALGATDLEQEGMGYARMKVGAVSLSFRQKGWGANATRMNGHAYAADNAASQRAYQAGRPVSFPEATFDPTRPLAVLVADIRRRLIDKSAPALASIAELAAAQDKRTNNLETHAAAYRARFPGLTVAVDHSSARVHGLGISGTMASDGGLYFDRISVDADKAARIIAIIAER